MSDYPLASRAAAWLGLVAAPTFALMALLSSAHGGQAHSLCSAAHDAMPIDGMTLMYLLMSVFHSPPWLNLVFGRRRVGPWAESRHSRSR